MKFRNKCFFVVVAGFYCTVAIAQGQKPATHYWMSVETRNMTIPGLSAEDSAMMSAMGPPISRSVTRLFTMSPTCGFLPTPGRRLPMWPKANEAG